MEERVGSGRGEGRSVFPGREGFIVSACDTGKERQRSGNSGSREGEKKGEDEPVVEDRVSLRSGGLGMKGLTRPLTIELLLDWGRSSGFGRGAK